jgi:hypothetical protein
MQITPGFSTAFRVRRGPSGQWEVIEEGCHRALARFEAPQAALSFACIVAEAKNGSLAVVFDELPRTGAPTRSARALRGAAPSAAFAGQAS